MKSFHDRFFITYLKSRKAQSIWNLGRRVIFCNTIKEITFDGFRNAHDKWRRWISMRISRIFVCYENPHFESFSVTKSENDLFNFELWMFLAMFGHGLEASICIPLCLWNAMHFCPYRQDKSEILFTFRQFASQHVPSFRLKLALKFGSNKTFLIIFKK